MPVHAHPEAPWEPLDSSLGQVSHWEADRRPCNVALAALSAAATATASATTDLDLAAIVSGPMSSWPLITVASIGVCGRCSFF